MTMSTWEERMTAAHHDEPEDIQPLTVCTTECPAVAAYLDGMDWTAEDARAWLNSGIGCACPGSPLWPAHQHDGHIPPCYCALKVMKAEVLGVNVHLR